MDEAAIETRPAVLVNVMDADGNIIAEQIMDYEVPDFLRLRVNPAMLTDANMGWSIAITATVGVTHNANAIQFAGGVLSGNSFISLNDFAHATTAGASNPVPVTSLAASTTIRGAGSYRIG